MIKNNLGVEAEQDLRSALVKRLARGCVYSGSGNIFTLEERSSSALRGSVSDAAGVSGATLCYYCLLRDEADEDASPDESVVDSNEYLVWAHECVRDV